MPEFVLNIGDYKKWLALDKFTRAYIEAAFFSSSYGENGEHELNETYSVDHLAPDTLERMKADCAAFYAANRHDIEFGFVENARYPEITAAWRAGTDFWFTRNGHGVGFWEGDRWLPEQGERLSTAAKAFGEYDLYPGDDENSVHGSRGC